MSAQSLASESRPRLLSFQPAIAWFAILALVVFTAIGIALGAGSLMNILFPAGSLLVGIFLYFRAPILYLGFSWWMWFLAPLVRRISDFRSTFVDPSPMLLAPYLVSLVTLITLVRYLPTIRRRGMLPYGLAAAGVFYGLLIGLINRSFMIVVVFKEGMDWLAPVAFGFHILLNWRDYPAQRQNIERTFIWGVLVMSIYGIVQFTALPDWDRLWLLETGMNGATGSPDENGGMRIWSTMQSGEPFAAFMAAALLLMLNSKDPLCIPASIVGYLAFLLSMVRSGWLAWLAGVLALMGSTKANVQIRLIASLLILALCVVPLTTIEPFSEKITSRLETLSNVQEDGSTQGRQRAFRDTIETALLSGVGEGIGGGSRDSTILAMLFDLGWIGTALYLGGFVPLVFRLMTMPAQAVGDPAFLGVARAIVVSALVRLPVNGSILGVSGVVLWTFLGLSFAAQKYHQRQRSIASMPSALPSPILAESLPDEISFSHHNSHHNSNHKAGS